MENNPAPSPATVPLYRNPLAFIGRTEHCINETVNGDSLSQIRYRWTIFHHGMQEVRETCNMRSLPTEARLRRWKIIVRRFISSTARNQFPTATAAEWTIRFCCVEKLQVVRLHQPESNRSPLAMNFKNHFVFVARCKFRCLNHAPCSRLPRSTSIGKRRMSGMGKIAALFLLLYYH